MGSHRGCHKARRAQVEQLGSDATVARRVRVRWGGVIFFIPPPPSLSHTLFGRREGRTSQEVSIVDVRLDIPCPRWAPLWWIWPRQILQEVALDRYVAIER
jgi:hypothetical protein